MTRPSRTLKMLTAIVMAVPFLLVATPGNATPDNTKVARVFELPCSSSVCDAAEDQPLSEGAVVDGSIQVHVTARSTIGLDWIELHARQVLDDTGAWVCLRHWSDPGSNVAREFNWNTEEWPGGADPPAGCDGSSHHGDLTRNASYDLRVVSKDATGSTISPLFTVKVSNGAETPQWVQEPAVEGADERNAIVELSWRANPEPDVREYHFIREGNGDEREYAVSASKPGGQGCSRDGDVYTCYDDDFSSEGYGGSYTYSIVAMRASPSSRQACSLPPYGDCVESSRSDTRSLSIKEPEPGPDAVEVKPTKSATPTPSPRSSRSPSQVHRTSSNSGGSGGSSAEFFQGEFERELPYDDNSGFALPGDGGQTRAAADSDEEQIFVTDTSNRIRALRVLALGLLMLLVSAHLARFLREPREPA